MHLPVVTMNLNYDDNIENKSKSISFSLNAEQFAVLFAGKICI
jgi:outer membrane PBP1 activator LpoA protein